MNDLGEEGTLAFARSLQDKVHLSQLDISYNAIGESGATAVAEVLQGKSDLAVFKADKNDLGVDGATRLASALSSAQKLALLSLSNNALGDDGIVAMSETLTNKRFLSQLLLDNNNIHDIGAVALAKALQNKQRLSEVSLPHNFITDDGALTIARSLAMAPSLRVVDFSFNPISSDAESAIRTLLPHVRDLIFFESALECPSLCPLGGLVNPDLVYEPTGELCSQRESSCLFGGEDCGTCTSMQSWALVESDCCGTREPACYLECPEGLALNSEGFVNVQGSQPLPCGVVFSLLETGVLPLPCSQYMEWVLLYMPCCV
jgi:hypothetical protein